MPPERVTNTSPLAKVWAPEQSEWLNTVILDCNCDGSFTITVSDNGLDEQPFISVTVTTYTSAIRFELTAVLTPLLQE